MFEVLSLVKQEHHGSSKSVLWGGGCGAPGRGWLGSQLLLPTRLVLSSNPEANVSAWVPRQRIKLAGLQVQESDPVTSAPVIL